MMGLAAWAILEKHIIRSLVINCMPCCNGIARES